MHWETGVLAHLPPCSLLQPVLLNNWGGQNSANQSFLYRHGVSQTRYQESTPKPLVSYLLSLLSPHFYPSNTGTMLQRVACLPFNPTEPFQPKATRWPLAFSLHCQLSEVGSYAVAQFPALLFGCWKERKHGLVTALERAAQLVELSWPYHPSLRRYMCTHARAHTHMRTRTLAHIHSLIYSPR